MLTINISLPEKLKRRAEVLIDAGYYVSFSDLVRDALRRAVEKDEGTRLLEKAKKEIAEGKYREIKDSKDLEDYLSNL